VTPPLLRGLRLRPGRESDLDDVIRIWRDTWRESYAGYFNTGADDTPWLQSIWQEFLPLMRCFIIAELDCRVVGFAHRDGSLVEDLWVDPLYCSRGIGPRLLTHALHAMAADGHRTASLFCLEVNSRARHFYEREGWRPALRQMREQPDGREPFWLMRYEYDLHRLNTT
jgi:ribosomal protein S18 acetylase RimI-like enzyme